MGEEWKSEDDIPKGNINIILGANASTESAPIWSALHKYFFNTTMKARHRAGY